MSSFCPDPIPAVRDGVTYTFSSTIPSIRIIKQSNPNVQYLISSDAFVTSPGIPRGFRIQVDSFGNPSIASGTTGIIPSNTPLPSMFFRQLHP